MTVQPIRSSFRLAALFLCLLNSQAFSQQQVDLSNLSAFKKTAANWQIAGNVRADLTQKNIFIVSPGKGILVNQPVKDARENLFTAFEHGDLDIELDYMMATGSNSGVYLQGRYEVQLLDSWGVLRPYSGDNGGIYERWDDNRPEGKKGYEGYAPRQNVSKAPGLWQHLKISFQAPRFSGGKKSANARFIRVELNGVVLHENVELTGPTRSSMADDEVALGPLMIQGDHGPVAFRNISYTQYNKERPTVDGIRATIYKGKYTSLPDLTKLKSTAQKNIDKISATIDGIPANEFIVQYTGTLHVEEAGPYRFNLHTSGGPGRLSIAGKTVIPEKTRSANFDLQAGDWPFELVYAKYEDWQKAAVALETSGPGIRTTRLTELPVPTGDETDPILVNAPEPTILRSFMDIPKGKRVVHAVSVGSPEGLHYTYDMDNGMMFQAWRGEFLDATPMWHERGDGSSRPTGSILALGQPAFQVYRSTNTSDTAGASCRTKGYQIDDKNRPVFMYEIYGKKINDAIRLLDNNKGFSREISIAGDGGTFLYKIAQGSSFEEIAPGKYIVNDKAYYLDLDETNGGKPILNESNGIKELFIPFTSKLRYAIIF